MVLNEKRLFEFLILVLLVSMVGSGCSRVVIKAPVSRPAEVNLGKKNRVTIGSISGEGGKMVASYISDDLSRSDRIELISPQVNGTIKPSVLIEGDMTNSYQEDIEEQTKTCTRRVQRKDGSHYDEEYDCTEYRRVGYVSVRANFRVIDAETGRLIVPKSASCEKRDWSIYTRYSPPRINRHAMFSDCCREVAWELAKTISPYTELTPVVFYKDRSLPWLEHGIVRAEQGQWDDAVAEFREAVRVVELDRRTKPEVAAKAYWDLGVALGYSGEFFEAEIQLRIACSKDRHMECNQAMNELLRLQREHERLKEQMGE